MTNFRCGDTEHLLAPTHVGPSRNEDIVTGLWRPVNLRLAPFNFPEPFHLVEDPHKGLWRLADLHPGQPRIMAIGAGRPPGLMPG